MSETQPSGAMSGEAGGGTGILTTDALPAPPPPPAAPVVEASAIGRDAAPPPPPPPPPSLDTDAPASTAASMPVWARQVPMFGPPGRRRAPWAVVALSVVSLGWYAVGWVARTTREVAEFDPHMLVRPVRSAMAVAVPLLLGWLVALAEAARLVADRLGHAPSLPLGARATVPLLAAPLAVPYLLLVLPFAVVAVAMTAERVRTVQERVAIPDERQLRAGRCVAWLLVPIVGGLVLVGREQARLNEVWARVTH